MTAFGKIPSLSLALAAVASGLQEKAARAESEIERVRCIAGKDSDRAEALARSLSPSVVYDWLARGLDLNQLEELQGDPRGGMWAIEMARMVLAAHRSQPLDLADQVEGLRDAFAEASEKMEEFDARQADLVEVMKGCDVPAKPRPKRTRHRLSKRGRGRW